MKRSVLLLVKALVSVLLIGLLLARVDLGALAQALRDYHPGFLVLSILLAPVLIWASSEKWRILVRGLGDQVAGWRLFHFYMVGSFFNNFLPTNVGGDVVRVVQLGRATGRPLEAAVTVVVERVTGLIALVLTAAAGLALYWGELGDRRLVSALVIVVGILGAALMILLVPALLRILGPLLPGALERRLAALGERMRQSLAMFRRSPRVLAAALLWSLAFYLLAALNVYVTCLAFRQELGLLPCLAIAPLVLVVAMVPVSLGGVGMMEWAYVFTLGGFGVAAPAALSVALLMRLKSLGFGLIGGLLYLASGVRQDAGQLQAKA
ncbi:MAG TPA: lysylphosphatidylglycerol synthase transmembrane domain-containing protein [Acidobacteriota bacterium]